MTKNKKFITTLALASLMGVSAMAITQLGPGFTYQYSRNTAIGDRSAWLSALPDATRFSQLSLPGTNDSMAYASSLSRGNRTQSLNMAQQLKQGIRVFDLGYVTNTRTNVMSLHTGDAAITTSRYEPFEAAIAHLKANPRETIYLQITQENSNVSSDVFGRSFLEYASKYGNYFYKGDSQNPTLGETRGKIVLLSDIQSLINTYDAIDIRNFVGTIDESFVNGKSNLYSHWTRVQNLLTLANREKGTDNVYVNNMAGYGAYAQPWFVASGQENPNDGSEYMFSGQREATGRYPGFPRQDGKIFYAGMNPMARDFIRSQDIDHTGIVYTDFPGYTLVEEIIAANY